MPQHEHEHGYNEIEFTYPGDSDTAEGLDQWQLSDFEDLLPGRF